MGIVQVMLGVPTICIVRVTTPQVQWNFDPKKESFFCNP